MNINCPCNKQALYSDCYQSFHQMRAYPETAEQLMRSRYSAYALILADYLVETTHRDKLKATYRTKLMATIHDIEWTNLTILKTSAGGPDDKAGKVAFEASYIEEGSNGVMKEHSRFRKHAGRWYYYDGKG